MSFLQKKYFALRFNLLLILTTLLLTGCRDVAIEVAPFSTSAKNQIKNGVYYGKIGSRPDVGSFSVKVPQANSLEELSELKTKELVYHYSADVSFGPTSKDATIYRVLVAVGGPMTFEEMKTKYIVPTIPSNIEKIYKQPVNRVYQKDVLIQSHPAVYMVYTQHIPKGFMAKEETLTHSIYCIWYPHLTAILWMTGSSSGKINAISDRNRNEVINRTWKPQEEFVNSFRVYD